MMEYSDPRIKAATMALHEYFSRRETGEVIDWNRLSMSERSFVRVAAKKAVEAANAAAIPPGWRLVPEEPTDAMVNAAINSKPNWRAFVRAAIAAAPEPETPKDAP